MTINTQKLRDLRKSGQIKHNSPSPISAEFLRHFRYEDGRIFRVKDGTLADTYQLNTGYRWVRLQRNGVQERHVAHRIIWTMHNGPIPRDMEIDHIDRDRSNNRISNLRAVTRSLNEHNKEARGATFRADCNGWQSQIRTPAGRLYLGIFRSREAAEAAYAKEKARFSPHARAALSGDSK